MSVEATTPEDATAASPSEAGTQVTETENPDQNTSLWNYPATYTLLGLNLLIFGLMYDVHQAQQLWHAHAWLRLLTDPFDIETLRRFGASDGAQILNQHQWWRLVTGTFVHVTMLHLLLNMWCLWNLGLFGEPLLGRRGLVAVYLLTGTAGMLLSLIWGVLHHEIGTVAGASGSVFGLAGILIVLLSNRKLDVPWKELHSLRLQVIFFAVANLLIGMAPNALNMIPPRQLAWFHLQPEMLPRIDNTAHLGGFLCGLALGLPLFSKMMAGRAGYRRRQAVTYALAAVFLVVICVVVGLARNNV